MKRNLQMSLKHLVAFETAGTAQNFAVPFIQYDLILQFQRIWTSGWKLHLCAQPFWS